MNIENIRQQVRTKRKESLKYNFNVFGSKEIFQIENGRCTSSFFKVKILYDPIGLAKKSLT